MTTLNKSGNLRFLTFSWLGCLTVIICVAAAGCESTPPATRVGVDKQVELFLPEKIEILPFTKPRSWDGDERPDGLEVVLRPLDAFGDQTKAIGNFRFELYMFRRASSDNRGQRVGFWQVNVDSKKAQMQHWDAITRTYRFRLRWDGPEPLPGKYILEATYLSAWAKRISNRYILQLIPEQLLIKENMERQLQGSR